MSILTAPFPYASKKKKKNKKKAALQSGLWKYGSKRIVCISSSPSWFCRYNACWVCLCFHNPTNFDMDCRIFSVCMWSSYPRTILGGSPSRGGDVTVYVYDISQSSLPTPFNYVLVSVSVFMTLSTVFHSINSPDNSPFSHSVLPVLSLPYWSFQLYLSLWKSPSALM